MQAATMASKAEVGLGWTVLASSSPHASRLSFDERAQHRGCDPLRAYANPDAHDGIDATQQWLMPRLSWANGATTITTAVVMAVVMMSSRLPCAISRPT
jgi:hypothetical protein